MSWYQDLDKDVATAAKKLAGNWQRFESFAWHGRHEVERPEDCAILNLTHRDSDLLDESNEHAIEEALSEFPETDVWHESHSHWAVGHTNALVIRCIDAEGMPTEAFKVLHELAMSLADYPVLDEDDFSDRQCETADKAWDDYGVKDFRGELRRAFPRREMVIGWIPEEHLRTVWHAMAEDQLGGESEIHEGNGVYFPFDRALKRMTWTDFRRIMLDIAADQGPMRVVAKYEARKKEKEVSE